MTSALLEGITAIELGSSVAAPFAAQVLADLGARVIKVEEPTQGDSARLWGPPFDGGGSPVFRTLNRNKRSVTVDLKDRFKRDELLRLILAEGDVVIQNLRPGLVETFELDAARLRAAKPELIYCNVSAFGARGPKSMRPGYDPLMQAEAGIMSITGHHGDEPVRVGPSIVDQGAGMWAVIGILTALLQRSRTGEGCVVDTSLYEAAIAWVPSQLASYLATGEPPRRLGSEMPTVAPYRAYKASDGWVVVAAGNDGLFGRLCRALGMDELAGDPKFRTNPERVANREALNLILASRLKAFASGELVERLEAAGVPCGKVRDIAELVEAEQFKDLGMLQPVGTAGERLAALPLSFDGTRPRLRSPAPALGEGQALLKPYEEDTTWWGV